MSHAEGRLCESLDALAKQQGELVVELTKQQDVQYKRLEMLLNAAIKRKNAIVPGDLSSAFSANLSREFSLAIEPDIASPVLAERSPLAESTSELSPCYERIERSRQSEVTAWSKASANESIAREQIRLARRKPCDARSVWHKYVPRGSRRLEVLRRSVMDGSLLQRLKRNRYYEVFVLLVILSNSLYIGFKTEYEAQIFGHSSETCYDCDGSGLAFYWVDVTYTIIFLLEWILRVSTDRCSFFQVCSPEFGWNAFDTIVLAMMILDEVSDYIVPGGVNASQVSMLRILRMVRIFRAFRLIRVVKFLRELRIVMTTIIIALRSLLWTFCVITMMLYVFAIVMTQGTLEYCSLDNACTNDDTKGLRDHFGTLSKSGLTLFMTMSNGVSWNDVFLFLTVLNPLYAVAFVAFVCIALFALLNVISGVFVETTLSTAKLDDAAVIEEEVRTREKYLERLHGIFNSLDLDKDGKLTSAEFDLAFMDERVVALFNAAGIDTENSRILFNLIDKDMDGVVSMDDFWRGCMRLKGEARALDLSWLQVDIDWLCKNLRIMRDILVGIAEERQVALECRSTYWFSKRVPLRWVHFGCVACIARFGCASLSKLKLSCRVLEQSQERTMSYIETRLRELSETLTEQQRDLVDRLIEQQDTHFERLERLLKIVVGRTNLVEPCDIPALNEGAMPECALDPEADASVAIPTERDPIRDSSCRVSPLLFGSELSRQLSSELMSPPLYDNPEIRTSVRKSILASAHESVDDLSDDDVRAQNRLATKELGDARSVWHKLLPRGSRRLEALRLGVKSGSALQRLKSNRSYEVFILLAIISNSLYIGFKTEYAAETNPSTSENCYQCDGSGLAFYWVDVVYTIIFSMEWVLRVCVDKWAFFHVCSPEFGWNAFDSFVLAMMLLDEVSVYIIPGGVNSSQLSMLRLLRMVRVFRAFRLVRVLKFLRELRIVMNTVVSALRSLVWTFCVIFMMLYVFAIVMTQGTVEYCSFEDACNSDNTKGLRNHFGTISRSGLTLFMSMSNGNQWEDVYDYLGVLNPLYPIAFVVFVCLALFALLNIVNGVFVETTLHAAKLDDVAVIEEEIRVREKYLERLHGIFNSLDINGDGVLSSAEFELAFMDERVVALFNAAGIDPDNSRVLFNLIDKDLDGVVSMDDFWRGCMRLRGAAKALELCQLQIDIDWLCKNVRIVRNLLIDIAEERRAAELGTAQSDWRSTSKRSTLFANEVDRRSVSKRSNYFVNEVNRRSMSKRSNV